MRSFIKGIFSLSIMLLLAGIFTMVPSFIKNLEKQTSQEISSQADGENLNFANTNADVSLLANSLTSSSLIYNGIDVYLIKDAGDLATVAYLVNSGIDTYASENYYLSADIDLVASSWTPIGTNAHPFKGNFFGNGKTISNVHINNITVDQDKTSGVGLFGTVDGGSISDLTIGGSFSFDVDGYANVGNLVGNIINGELINCYDSTSSNIANSVGTNTNTKYYKGNNGTALKNLSEDGNVAIYTMTQGQFYIADTTAQTKWRENKTLRVVLDTNYNDSISSIKNPIYTTHKPQLREAIASGLSASDKYVYPLLQGYKASINNDTYKITFSEVIVSANFNYGYGTRKGAYSIPYDTAFLKLDPQYINRAGYTLNTINGIAFNKLSEDNDADNLIYDQAYPKYKDTEENVFTWTANKNGYAVGIIFENKESVDNEAGYDNPSNWWSQINLDAQVSNANGTVDDIRNFTYQITEIREKNGVVQTVITFSIAAWAEASFDKDTGIVFENHSGTIEKGSYQYGSNINYDDYNKVTAKLSEVQVVEGKNQYTLTITNLVSATAGNIKVGISRVKYPINLNIKDVDGNPYKNYSIECAQTLDGEKPYIKAGQTDFSLKITLNDQNYVFLTEPNGGEDGAFASIEYSDLPVNPITLTLSRNYVTPEANISLVVGEKKTRVNIIYQDTFGKELDINKINNELKISLGEQSLSIVQSSPVSIPVGGTKLTANSNPYYTIKKIEIKKNGSIVGGGTTEEGKLTCICQYDFEDIYTGQGGNEFNYEIVLTYEERKLSAEKPDFVFEIGENTYNLYDQNGLNSVIGSLFNISIYNNTKKIYSSTDASITEHGYEIGDKLKIELTLTDIGKSILYGATDDWVKVTEKTVYTGDPGEIETDTAKVDSGTWVITYTVGDNDIGLTFKFAYKQINISIDGLVKEESLNNQVGVPSTTLKTTIQYNHDENGNLTTSIVEGYSPFKSISIPTQYYLLGWYISGADCLSSNFADYYGTNSVNLYQTKTKVEGQINTLAYTVSVKAVVGDRIIKVKYKQGEVDGGEFKGQNDIAGGQISYNTAYSVYDEGSTFSNFGHTLTGWLWKIPTSSISTTTSIGSTIKITGGDWSKFFGVTEDNVVIQNWKTFFKEADSVKDPSTSKEANLELTAQWKKISYIIKFDGTEKTIHLGDVINFTPSPNPGQSGLYSITGVNSYTLNSDTSTGHKAVSFKISQGSAISGRTTITLNLDNLKSILSGDYYYIVNNNDSAIVVTTEFEAAKYKLYIQESEYYTITYGDLTDIGGTDDNGTFVYVTYGQKPVNLTNALKNDLIEITRYGYTFNKTFKNFNLDEEYKTASDKTLTPVFTKNNNINTTTAGISFDSGVGSTRNFYILNPMTIANASLIYNEPEKNQNYSGDNLTIGTILPNGERIVSFGINIYKDGSALAIILDSKNVLSLEDFIRDDLLAGEYSVTFFVNLQDTMDTNIKRNPISSKINFNVLENTIVLNSDNDIVSVFNNSKEFVPASINDGYDKDNKFGTFRLNYNYNGSITSDKTLAVSLVNFVNPNMVEIFGDYNVGKQKNVTIKVLLNNLTSINGINISSITNWDQIFTNVEKTKTGSEYNLKLEGVAEIVKGRFTIDFGDSSSYYFGGDGQTIVKENNNTSDSFSIGNSNFNYSYDKITYIGAQTSGKFTGKENKTVFNVENIVIEGFANWANSFEYLLEGNFELIDTIKAIQKSFSTRYLTATNKTLSSSLLTIDNMSGLSADLSLLNITYGGQKIGSGIDGEKIYGDIFEEDGNYTYGESLTYKVNNKIVFSFTKNGSNEILFYANPSDLKVLSFEISTVLSGTGAQTFRPLTLNGETWNISNSVLGYEKSLNSQYENNSLSSIYTFDNHGTGAIQNVFMVLSNVRKVNLNYNGGQNTEGAGSEIIYISAGQTVNILNPVHTYAGLSFVEYKREGNTSDPTLSKKDDHSYDLSAITGGGAITLTAKWKISDIIVDAVKDKNIDLFASLTETPLDITRFITENLYLDKATFSYSFENTENTFTYSNNQIVIKDKNGQTPSTLSGTYSLKITLTYSDDISGQSTITKTINDYILTINKNVMSFDNSIYSFVYNNNQRQDFNVNLTKNGTLVSPLPTLNQLINAQPSEYGIKVSISGKDSTIKLAGTYTVTATIADGMTNFFELGDKSSITVTIEKYSIDLNKDFLNQINLSKQLGEKDPLLEVELVISANNSEKVLISFDRREEGETAGKYDLIDAEIADADDQNNYVLVASKTVVDKFEILVPNVSLQLKMTSQLEFVYNGAILSNLTISHNQNNEFTLSGLAGEKNVSATFILYYTNSNGVEVAVPNQEGENYCSYLTFSISGNNKNAGSYPLEPSLTSEGQSVGWTALSFENSSYNSLLIKNRDIIVTGFTTVFDQNKTFIFADAGKLSNFTFEEGEDKGIVDGDNVTITVNVENANAGQSAVTSMDIDNISSLNYNLIYTEGLNAVITPSSDTISTSITEKTLNYGDYFEDISVHDVLTLIPFTFNGLNLGTINNSFYNIENIYVTDASYSTGGYLKVTTGEDKWALVFTVSSTNLTFGKQLIDGKYTTTFTINLTVNPIALTISNAPSTQISKDYDGNAIVPSKFVNQNVGQANGYYTAQGLLSGDKIVIESANFAEKTIGTHNLTLNYGQDDSSNYTITNTVKGTINNVTLTFEKNVNTYSFVTDDGENVENIDDFQVVYNGNISEFISEVINKEHFASRVGYYQTGWRWNNTIISVDMENAEEFLQTAVDDNIKNGKIVINAAWDVEKYDITFKISNFVSIKNDSYDLSKMLLTDIEYWTSIDNIIAKAVEGYYISEIKANNSNITISSLTGVGTNNSSFNLTHLTGDTEININTEEILVKITIDLNPPAGFTAGINYDVDTSWKEGDWTANGNTLTKQISYTELFAKDLPIVKITQNNTYNWESWYLGEIKTENLSVGNNIWQRISGSNLTQNDLIGFKFIATWTESPLTITFNVNNATIKVYVNDEPNAIEPKDGEYTLHYLDKVRVDIVSDDWYKFTGGNITGSNTSNIEGSNEKRGSFVINSLTEAKTITLNIEQILVSFITSSEESTLFGTTVTDTVTKRQFTYSEMFDDNSIAKTLENGIGKYSATAGTYSQIDWKYNDTNIGLGTTIEDFIVNNGGIPTKDISYNLLAVWLGETYTVTFEKGTPQEGKEAVFEGNDANLEEVTRDWIYGSIISNIPVVKVDGQSYYWANINNTKETFAKGNRFVLNPPDNTFPYELTLEAQWSNDVYTLNVSIKGADGKVTNIMVGEDNYTVESLPQQLKVIYGDSRTFSFTLSTGYMVDNDINNTKILTDLGPVSGFAGAVLTVNGNSVTISGIHGNITAQISIKAKPHKITIEKQGDSVTASVNEFDVSYDQDITNLFDDVKWNRGGYKIASLYEKESNALFATKTETGWTFENSFTSLLEDKYIYTTDKDISLIMVWTLDNDNLYFSGKTTAENGLYYNGTSQLVATTTFTIENIIKDAILNNLDKVVDVYYMIGDKDSGTRIDYSPNYTLYYTDALNDNVCMVVELKDTLSRNNFTYKISTEYVTGVISPSDVKIIDANIESYYTGSGLVVPSNEDSYNNGTLYFHDGITTISELTISKVEFVAKEGEFNVGEDYQIKYYFTTSSNFKMSNFEGLSSEGEFITFIPQLSMVSGKIVPSIIDLELSGKAFENGKVQQITHFTSTLPAHAQNFVITINSIYTKTSDPKLYDSLDVIVIDYLITRGEEEIKKFNFVFNILGDYEIVSYDKGYQLALNVEYLDIDSGNLSKNNQHNLTIKSFTHNSKSGNITENSYSYLDENGNLIFSIYNNGTENITVNVIKGKSVTFNFTLNGTMEILSWNEGIVTYQDAVTQLEGLTSSVNRNKSFTTSDDNNTLTVIVTNFKAIKLSLGDKDGGGLDQGYAYIKLGANKIVDINEDNKWKGFDFVGWNSLSNGVNISDNTTINVQSDAKILTANVVAIWQLQAPDGQVSNVQRDAKPAVGALIDAVNFAYDNLTNYNEDIQYSFIWRKEGQTSQLHNEKDGFTVLANTDSTGNYTITVKASYGSYVSQSKTFTFNLEIKTIDIGAITISPSGPFVYSNYDFIEDINVEFKRDDIGTIALKNLFDLNSNYWFTLSGQNNLTIKDAGNYTLTLNLNNKVFNASTFTQTITVEKKEVVISQDMIPQELTSKLFGTDDPNFVFDKLIEFSEKSTQETISISLTRDSGEASGIYDFISISTNKSSNFDVKMAESGLTFQILTSNNTLNIIVNSQLSKTYDKQKPVLNITYDEGTSSWKISINETDSTSSISLTASTSEGQTIALNSDLYKLALQNVSITAKEDVVNVNSYTGSDFEITANSGANFTKFNLTINLAITQREISIESASKIFDRTTSITSDTTVKFNNLIDGDDVILQGNFEKETVGQNISLKDLSLKGIDANNYYLIQQEYFGSIIPLEVLNASVNVYKYTLTYGSLNISDSLSEIIQTLEGIETNLDGKTNDLEKGYVTIEGWSISEEEVSTSGYLNVGSKNVTFTLTSDNFTFKGLAKVECYITLTINQLDLDLSTLSIVKNYDETTNLPYGFDNNIDELLCSYNGIIDDVQIDITNSHYNDAEVGDNKSVVIVLIGEDSANYNPIKAKGTINKFSIAFKVIADEEDINLVSGGYFVNDGLTPSVKNPIFYFEFPSSYSAAQLISQLVTPTRPGYRATGWKIYKDGNYITLDSSNILDLIKEIAYDETNITKSINIYTVWEIRTYTANVSGSNFEYLISGDGYHTDTNTFDYYSSLTIAINAHRGYKYSGSTITGTYVSVDRGETGIANTNITINNISTNISININMDIIKITINILPNLPSYTQRVDSEKLSVVTGYFDLSTMTLANLPQLKVTDGTYHLKDYSYLYNLGDVQETGFVGNQYLKDVIDIILPKLLTDSSVSISAVWEGENYIVYFDPNGGTLESGNSVNVIYGSNFTDSFPVAVSPGRSNTWLASDGITYQEGDTYHTIGQFNSDNDIWEATLTAQWRNNPYILTVEFDDKISVSIDGQDIVSGQTYEIIYNENSVVLQITPDRGYEFEVIQDSLNGELIQENNNITISNLIQNGKVVIQSLPAENNLSFNIFNISKVEQGILNEETGEFEYTEIKTNNIIALTESTVTLKFTPNKGYEFNESSASLVGISGEISYEILESGEIIITWTNFTTDENLTVKATESTNYITFADISQYFSAISFNNRSYNVTGDSVPVLTGQTLNVTATLKYGYYQALVTSSLEGKITNQDCIWNDSLKCYTFTATIENIDEGFDLSFSCVARSYTFILSVADGQEEIGEISSQIEQTVEFNGFIDLKALTIKDEYIFANWQWNGITISVNDDDKYQINEKDKDLLESAVEGKLYIYANFREKLENVTFLTAGKGYITYSQNIGEEVVIDKNTTAIKSLYLGQSLVVRFIPDEGYEVDQVLIDDVVINLEDYNYDQTNNSISFVMDVNYPVKKIAVSFKASDAYVIVQSVVMVNYRPTYGVTDGGLILLCDSEGNKLEDSVYLENDGNLVIGADYRYLSKTDDTVYFIIEGKEGFEINFVANNLQDAGNFGSKEINGKTVYFINGVKDGCNVKVTFTALANTVEVYFVSSEGSTVAIDGGIIVADTSSPLVQVNGNNSNHLKATVTTGANLNLVINSGISFNLIEDENGNLKYGINSQLHEGVITVGKVNSSNLQQTGYTNTATLEISQVDGNVVIYIIVQPKIYDLNFYVKEGTSVLVENAIVYGQEINLSILTQEQKDIIFQQRSGFTLSGYYTVQYGQGIQYIDRYNEVTKIWNETGYYWDGQSYQVESNFFDPVTQTFTLYAAWEYDKSSITITFIPEGFEENPNVGGISDVIVKVSPSTEIPWFDQNNIWYADVTAGVSITLRAYEFTGYEFKYWSVSKDGQSLGLQAPQFEMKFEQGDYVIEAVYYPLFSLTTNGDGGTTYLIQDGQIVTQASYDPSKIVSLQATPKYGYNFLYWQVVGSDETIIGSYDETTGSYIFNYPQLISTPLNLVAVFEGKETKVNLTTQDIQEGSDLSIKLDGEIIDISQPFFAKVGQTITISAKKILGYEYELLGGNASVVEEKISGYIYYVYTYVIDFKDIEIIDGENVLNIVFACNPKEIVYKFIYSVADDSDNSERALIGTLNFIDAEGKVTQITLEKNSFTILFGQTVTLEINSTSYYKVINIEMFDGLLYPNFTSQFKDGKLTITKEMIYFNFNEVLEFYITFERVLWIDQAERILEGDGTKGNPYLIHNEEEMAYVAYLVNNGITNENGNKYSDCVYELMSDLDFSGKYWVPIGTEENPFNGIMYLKKFSITNILHYTSYDPKTSYNGLFWILGDDAQIEQNDNTLVIVLSVIGGIIFLLLLLLLIILLLRKKKKKEMEELANG